MENLKKLTGRELWFYRHETMASIKCEERRLKAIEQELAELESGYYPGDVIHAESENHGIDQFYTVHHIEPAIWMSDEISNMNGYDHRNFRVFVTTDEKPEPFELLRSRINAEPNFLKVTIHTGGLKSARSL